ncbi:putative hydrolase, partial [Enterobacter ludwigii]
DFLIKSRKFSGFCYTQLTDVMQETNGLLREDRTPKLPLEKLEKIFGKKIYE